MQFNIKLSDAKLAIGIPAFKRDNLLIIALTDPSTLNRPEISVYERENRKKQYRRLALLGDALFDAVLIDYLFEVMMIGGMILHLLIVLEKMMISGVGGFGMYLW